MVAAFLTRIFALEENKTVIRTEVLAGVTTFLTMAYIIFVQPAILSGRMFGKPTGMDFGAVATATCLSAAIASAIMGLYARYPVAQAPGMGQNFFFVFSAVPAAAAAGFANAWAVALGMVFISGLLFLGFSLIGLREAVLNAISPSMKFGIAAGIGLFIAFIGLQSAGVIVKDPGTTVALNAHLTSPDLLVFFFGLLLAGGLQARRVSGAILWGIAGATLLAIVFRLVLDASPAEGAVASWMKDSALANRFGLPHGLVAMPPSLTPTFLKLDVRSALAPVMWPFIVVFLFMVLFDTVGTLVGVAEQAGFIKDNRLPRAREAFTSDALATTLGACLGTSTVTSYIESAAGIAQGGRTGMTALVVAALFLVALFFSPLIEMIGNYPPITAPALVLVGAMMSKNMGRVAWEDASESVPAFLIMLGIPLSYSIGHGLALGFIAYPVIKLAAGRGREVSWILYALAILLVAYFVLVRGRLA